MSKKLAKPFLLFHHSINTEYKKYDKIPKKYRVKNREELIALIKVICKHIGKEIVRRKAGVHIKRLGYFFVWKIPRKMTFKTQVRGGNVEEGFNYHSDHYMYSPIFLPSIDRNATFKHWNMDNSFVKDIKLGVKDKLKNGHTFKMYPYSIKRLNRM